jgi:hypothetical protein
VVLVCSESKASGECQNLRREQPRASACRSGGGTLDRGGRCALHRGGGDTT